MNENRTVDKLAGKWKANNQPQAVIGRILLYYGWKDRTVNGPVPVITGMNPEFGTFTAAHILNVYPGCGDMAEC